MIKHVYIDESGSPTLGDGHYVLAATFVPAEIHGDVLDVIQRASNAHFSNAEIKSNKVGRDHTRRVQVARSLSTARVRVEILVIKKDRLAKDGGFRFKRSMYKYCQRRLFSKIYKGFDNVNVVVDSFGNNEFRDGFKAYIDRRFQPTLFSTKNVTFSTPLQDPILQLSDFAAGTVRRHFNGDDPPTAFAALRPLINNLEIWPRAFGDDSITSSDDELDAQIRSHCSHVAEEFLQSSDDPILSEAVNYLLYSEAMDHDGFIYGDHILDHLKDMVLIDNDRDKSWLRQAVIAQLRESGVLIAACREGYKIPESVDDLQHFVEFVSNKTIRYLERVVMMRDSIYYGTNMKYDMLEATPELRQLLRPLADDHQDSS